MRQSRFVTRVTHVIHGTRVSRIVYVTHGTRAVAGAATRGRRNCRYARYIRYSYSRKRRNCPTRHRHTPSYTPLHAVTPPLHPLQLLEEETKLPNTTDATLLAKIKSSYDKHEAFSTHFKTPSLFTIKHYAGEVIYGADGWLQKSVELISPELVAAMRKSTLPLVAALFSQARVTLIPDPDRPPYSLHPLRPLRPLRPLHRRRSRRATRRSAPPRVRASRQLALSSPSS